MVQSYGKSSATKLQSLCSIIPKCSNFGSKHLEMRRKKSQNKICKTL